jgi:hypothetical protein
MPNHKKAPQRCSSSSSSSCYQYSTPDLNAKPHKLESALNACRVFDSIIGAHVQISGQAPQLSQHLLSKARAPDGNPNWEPVQLKIKPLLFHPVSGRLTAP